ncbi:MAG: HD domain-containing protein [Frankiaceae bacterium]|nr:HD domain-containing protein [Frankiaceae bacterium]MBV9870185.1 HD domain-containing protein [Frankiaceae bacterium]
MTTTSDRATFTNMADSTAEDWAIIGHHSMNFMEGLPDRVLAHLRLLDGDFGGFAVDRLNHSLQTARRAERAGRDDAYVLCALLHDIGDTLGSFNHADIAAAILKPFVSAEYHWMVEHHAEFQGYYFFHHLGLDRDMRDKHVDHPQWDLTAEFCSDFDSPAFDPAYDTPPLEHFEPLVRSMMASPVRSIYLKESEVS